MERNTAKSTVVSAADLSAKEYYCVGADGALTTTAGDAVYGIVSQGFAAGQGSEVVTSGETYANVTLTSTGSDLAIGTPLTGGASGCLVPATVGTHAIVAVSLEARTKPTSGSETAVNRVIKL